MTNGIENYNVFYLRWQIQLTIFRSVYFTYLNNQHYSIHNSVLSIVSVSRIFSKEVNILWSLCKICLATFIMEVRDNEKKSKLCAETAPAVKKGIANSRPKLWITLVCIISILLSVSADLNPTTKNSKSNIACINLFRHNMLI